jgi:mannose-6-phosphate isomerase-like protein (cupin superfamily)
MPDYAIVNLLEIDDSVAGRLEGLEGRFSRKHLGSRDLGVSHWRYAPGFKATTGHRHR